MPVAPPQGVTNKIVSRCYQKVPKASQLKTTLFWVFCYCSKKSPLASWLETALLLCWSEVRHGGQILCLESTGPKPRCHLEPWCSLEALGKENAPKLLWLLAESSSSPQGPSFSSQQQTSTSSRALISDPLFYHQLVKVVCFSWKQCLMWWHWAHWIIQDNLISFTVWGLGCRHHW